ncbi:MAG: hypothetical protein ABI972_15475 [Acidobacteriota bacterium]
MRVRGLVLSLLMAGSTWAQSQSLGTYTYDINGRRVLASQTGIAATPGAAANVRTTQTLNGRQVPAESVVEKVVSDGPDGKVVERVVKVFDENGRPVSTEKQVIKERKLDSGGSEVSTAVYRSDLNGNIALAERLNTVSAKSGNQITSQTVVERASLSGGLEPVERQQTVTQTSTGRTDSDTTVLRKDSNGSFQVAAREVVSTSTSGPTTTQNVTQYNSAATGQMEVIGQKVVTTTARPDGGITQVVDVYGMNTPGRAVTGYSDGPKLREQQIIEKHASASGGFVETYTIRRPNLESGALGPPVKISETVCTGNCIPPKPAADPKPVADPTPAADPKP